MYLNVFQIFLRCISNSLSFKTKKCVVSSVPFNLHQNTVHFQNGGGLQLNDPVLVYSLLRKFDFLVKLRILST
jgi:hypothetical protein